MTDRITSDERAAVLELLACGEDRETIAAKAGVTERQVAAVAAHVTMGTYALPESSESDLPADDIALEGAANRPSEGTIRIFPPPEPSPLGDLNVLLGFDAQTGDEVSWNPDARSGSVNPHVLVLGESGSGKTYSICCLTAELACRGINSIVIDYGQGFALDALPAEFSAATQPVEISASRDGVDANPLQLFPTDVLGPVNVAQRLADTFQRVYPRLGVQQHAVVRQAALDALRGAGILVDDRSTWNRPLPEFSALHRRLQQMAADRDNSQKRIAADAAAHLSTVFVFDTFRSSGRAISWPEMVGSSGRVFILQLRGLERSLEQVVTELLLWNLIGYIESLGPGPLRTFVVLDEAHRLSFDAGSPVEKILREGRKYGLGAILSSQQPGDFSEVAFANTATKLTFQVDDRGSGISRQLHRKLRGGHTFQEIFDMITKLPQGTAYATTENSGRAVRIASFAERAERWES